MATSVGTESTLLDLVRDLIKLDFAAIDAYNWAITKLSRQEFSRHLAAFRDDHLEHTRSLGTWLKDQQEAPPEGGGAKELLTTGKVALASIAGDKMIIQALKTHEDDTNVAYERAKSHGQADGLRPLFEKNLSDERRHRRWMEETLRALQVPR